LTLITHVFSINVQPVSESKLQQIIRNYIWIAFSLGFYYKPTSYFLHFVFIRQPDVAKVPYFPLRSSRTWHRTCVITVWK